jgi:ABC-type multidrug transport system ATPase subunit
VVLLDDPLSAVDSSVAEHIFQKLIVEFLSDRTRVLVTHQISLCMQHADSVVYTDSNKSVLQCAPDELMKTLQNRRHLNIDSKLFLDTISLAIQHNGTRHSASTNRNVNRPLFELKSYEGVLLLQDGDHPPRPSGTSSTTDEFPQILHLIQPETKSKGQVPLAVYMYYIDACGGKWVLLALVLICVFVYAVDLAQTVVGGTICTLCITYTILRLKCAYMLRCM